MEETRTVLEVVTPMVHVTPSTGEAREFPVADMLLPGEADIKDLSDSEILDRVARWMDVDRDYLSGHVVDKRENGNIVVHERPIYG